MGAHNLVFLEFLEWFDESGRELVHRLPEQGSADIKFGAQLTVRESQAAVFFYNGKAVGAFGPGLNAPQWVGIWQSCSKPKKYGFIHNTLSRQPGYSLSMSIFKSSTML